MVPIMPGIVDQRAIGAEQSEIHAPRIDADAPDIEPAFASGTQTQPAVLAPALKVLLAGTTSSMVTPVSAVALALP